MLPATILVKLSHILCVYLYNKVTLVTLFLHMLVINDETQICLSTLQANVAIQELIGPVTQLQPTTNPSQPIQAITEYQNRYSNCLIFTCLFFRP